MEREELESEPGDVSKTRKPSRNKLACSIACLDGANFNINIEVGISCFPVYSCLLMQSF